MVRLEQLNESGDMNNLLNKLKEYLNPTICRKHKEKLRVHGFHSEKFCGSCFDEVGKYTYE